MLLLKQKLKVTTGLVLSLALAGSVFTSCAKDDPSEDVGTLYLLQNFIGQLGGDCVTIDKRYDASGTATFSVTAYGIPAGGCNEATLLSGGLNTSTDTVKTKLETWFDERQALADSVTGCSTTASTLTSTKTSVTGSAALSGYSSSATSAGANGNPACTETVSGTGIWLCSDNDAVQKFREMRRYITLGDNNVNFASLISSVKTTADAFQALNGFSDKQISTMRLMNRSELPVFNSKATGVILFARANGGGGPALEAGCTKAIVDNDAKYKSVWDETFAVLTTPNLGAGADCTLLGGVNIRDLGSNCGTPGASTEAISTAEAVDAKKEIVVPRLSCEYSQTTTIDLSTGTGTIGGATTAGASDCPTNLVGNELPLF